MLDHLEGRLSTIASQTRFRETRIVDRGEGGLINLRDNDYLALIRDPRVIAASCEAVKCYGCSASGSPVVGGYLDIHEELEQALCDWTGYRSALLWPSGYSANRAFLQMLLKEGDIVLADRFIHRSMIEGVQGTRARLIRYQHCDLNHLESFLKQYAHEKRVFVLTESVFSMEGDLEDLPGMSALKERFPFFWIVDEAHAMGWYGPGRVRQNRLNEHVDVVVGTLGKSLASQGAFMLFQDPRLRDYCINLAPEFMYSTYLAPALAGAALGAIDLIRQVLDTGQPLWRKMALQVKRKLLDYFEEIPVTDTPIIPLVVGEEASMLRVHEALHRQGVLTGAIRPPSVPIGTSRIRMSLHRGLDVEALIMRVGRALGR